MDHDEPLSWLGTVERGLARRDAHRATGSETAPLDHAVSTLAAYDQTSPRIPSSTRRERAGSAVESGATVSETVRVGPYTALR